MSVTIDLHIDSIAAGGDGVGRHEGMVVFVPRTAPGDDARVCASRHDRLMRGQALEILAPSPRRMTPPCEHYTMDHCGGCQLQHLQYDAQVQAKAGIIRDALTRIGRTEVALPPVVPSDKPWRYRRKLTLALRRRDTSWFAGLHRFDAPDEVFELQDCPITQEDVVTTWAAIMRRQELLPDAVQLRGAVRALGRGFSFTLEGAQVWRTSGELFAAVPSLTELWWKPGEKSRRLLHSRGADEAGASFTQVNPAVAERLRECVVDLAAARRPATAVDAYAGTGDIAVALAAATGARVTAIEIDRDAARVCASRLPSGSTAITAPVEMALPRAVPADVVIVNPPRAGLDARVTDVLTRHPPARGALIYVSCNPATLARDVRRLSTYRVESLRGFDMFPQTAHVETVCELIPAA